MNNAQKGSTTPVLVAIIAILIVVGGVYIYESRKTKTPVMVDIVKQQTDKTKTDVTFLVSRNNLSVISDAKVTQTLSLGEQGVFALNVDSGNRPLAFIVDNDVNFDGHNDVGVLSSTGYAGVNYFYDFYIFNPTNQKLEKNAVISNIVLTSIDTVKKEIVSTYKSGPGYITYTYQWNGSTFIKSGPVPAQ